jgi:hypothetical protein
MSKPAGTKRCGLTGKFTMAEGGGWDIERETSSMCWIGAVTSGGKLLFAVQESVLSG